jgi:ATP-dependent DNA helicase RecQ
LLLPSDPSTRPRGASAREPGRTFVVRRRGDSAGDGDEALDAEALRRFEALRAHRLVTAQAEGVPPYVVASDRSLRELALLVPAREADLTLAHGIGEAKARKYGAGWLAVLRQLETSDDRD